MPTYCVSTLLLGVAAWVSMSSAAVGAELVLNEVLLDPVGADSGRQVVEVRNVSGTEVVMTEGYWLYFSPSSWQFPAGTVIPPDGTVIVHINRPGTASAGTYYTGVSGMRDLRRQDSIALFRRNVFSDPDEIVDFVEWGSAGNASESVAVEAGIWSAFDFISITRLREGSSFAYDGVGDLSSDWCIDGVPTLGVANDVCDLSYAKSPVRLSEIGYVRTGPGVYHPAIELKNLGPMLEDMGGKWLRLGTDSAYQFPLGSPETLVSPGEIVTVHLGVAGVDAALHFHTGAGTFRDLAAVDSASLHVGTSTSDPTSIIDFVAWGGLGSALEVPAVSAGLWESGTFVDTTGKWPRGSLAAYDVGMGASRWYIDNTSTLGFPNDTPPAPPVVVNEVLIDPAGSATGRGVVELRNMLDGETLAAGGLTLCTESRSAPGTLRCFSVPSGVSIPPGGFLLVNWNRLGANGSGFVNTGTFQEFDPLGGILLLFLTRDDIDANNLVDYVRWGAGSTAWEALADEFDHWPGDPAVGVDAVRDDSSIAWNGESDGASGYRIDITPSLGSPNEEPARDEPFLRADCNDDGALDISDAITLFQFLFLGAKRGNCDDACDSNDDAQVDISDPVFTLNYLFRGATPPPSPGFGGPCGPDTDEDAVTCNAFNSCPR